MGKVALVAMVKAKDGQRDELAAAFRRAFDAVDVDEGTICYILHTHDAEPDTLVVYELYESEAALAAHLDGPLTTAIGREVAPFIEGSKLEHLTPLAGKGL
jgi:quinol monooxygenase YgiN